MSVNTREILIGKGITVEYGASASQSTTDSTATSPYDLAEGSIGLFNGKDGTIIPYSDLTNVKIGKYPAIVIAQGVNPANGNQPVTSQLIQGVNLQNFLGKNYSNPQTQVAYVGYNGSGNSTIPVVSSTLTAPSYYQVKLIDITKGYEPFPRHTLIAKADTTATAYEILTALCSAIVTDANAFVYPEIVSDGTMGNFTGTATAMQFTAGSATVNFVIESSTGWVASTGSVTAGDAIGVANAGSTSVSFTADILGTGAGRHLIVIGGTTYNVADAGTAAQNATAIAAAINAGTQATAAVTSSTTVTITLKYNDKGQAITVTKTADDATFTQITTTVITTLGGTAMKLFNAVATVAAGASFTLDRPAQFSGTYYKGTSTLINAGEMSAINYYGLKLTDLIPGASFNVAVDLNLLGTPITYTTSPQPGSGTSAEILTLEQKAQGYTGYINRIWFPFPFPTYTVTNEKYDVITIKHNRVQDSMTMMDASFGQAIDTMLALPDGALQETKLLALLNSWANSSPRAFPTITL